MMKKAKIVVGVGMLVLVCVMLAWALPFTQTMNDTLAGGASTMTMLPDGNVLVAGGDDGINALNTAQTFSPGSGLFSDTTGTLHQARYLHSAASVTVSGVGYVLITGGRDEYSALNSAELYSAAGKTFIHVVSAMTTSRHSHSSTLLGTGSVLLIGGVDDSDTVLASTETFDPSTSTFVSGASMSAARYFHTATLLSLTSGSVLVTGGKSAFGNSAASASWSAVLCDAATVTTLSSHMSDSRFSHTATQLGDGRVLITGGKNASGTALNTAEIYDPVLRTFSTTSIGAMRSARYAHTATLLDNGKVLLAGGKNDSDLPQNTAEVFDPASGQFLPTIVIMNVQKFGHQAVLLTDNTVLLAGGYIVDHPSLYTAVPLNTGEIFDRWENISATTTNLATSSSGNGNISMIGDIVTFTATVSKATATVTGSVLFKDGATVLGTRAVAPSDGTALYIVPNLSAGNHDLTATYSGDDNYLTSISSPLTQIVSLYSTTIGVSSSKLNAKAGDYVLFTATISRGTATTWPVTGSVNFYFAGGTTRLTELSSAVVPTTGVGVGGIATFMTTSTTLDPAIRDYDVTAVYSGNKWFDSSYSASIAQTVNKYVTSVTVTSPQSTTKIGVPVIFTATVSNGTSTVLRTGTVTFTEGPLSLATVSLYSNNTATYGTSSLSYGAHQITATYNGDSFNDYSPLSTAYTQNVNLYRTTTVLTTSASNTAIGNTVMLSALVGLTTGETTTSASFVGTTVTFSAVTPTLTTLGTGTILYSANSGTYKKNTVYFTTDALQVGQYEIVATYNSNGTYSSSVSSAVTQTIDRKATSTVVSSSTGTYGSWTNAPVVFTATISQPTTLGTTTHLFTGGTVTFRNGSTDLGTAAVVSGDTSTSGVATLYTNGVFTQAGSYEITAVYGGDTHYYSSASTTFTHIVGKQATSTVVTSSTGTLGSVSGNPVTFTATISQLNTLNTCTYLLSGATVTFRNGSTDLGVVTVVSGPTSTSGVATLVTDGTFTLPGSYEITAEYGGDSYYSASTSTIFLQVVGKEVVPISFDTDYLTQEYDATQKAVIAITYPAGLGVDITYRDSTGAVLASSPISAGSYSVTAVVSNETRTGTATGTLTITPKPLTITGLTADSKLYDGTTAATFVLNKLNTLNGVAATDSITYTAIGSFLTPSVSSAATVTISSVTLVGSKAANYTVTVPTNVTGIIVKRPLTITGMVASNKVYDGTTDATLSNKGSLVGVMSVDTGTVDFTATAKFATKATGTSKLVTVATLTLTGSGSENYSVTKPTLARVVITPAPLAVLATGASKTYDGTTKASPVLSYHTFTGDVVKVTYPATGATFASKETGTSTVTVTGLVMSGTSMANYTLSSLTTTCTATISPKPLTIVGMTPTAKIYDGTTSVTIPTAARGTLSGMVTGETGSDNINFTIDLGNTTFATPTVGTSKPLSLGTITLTGALKAHYSLPKAPTVLGTITARKLQVIGLTAGTKPYDQTKAILNPDLATGVTLSGAVMSNQSTTDVITLNTATLTYATKHVGIGKSVVISSYTLTSADHNYWRNYTLDLLTSSVTGSITPVTITVTALTGTRTYDGGVVSKPTPTDTRFKGDVMVVTFPSASYADKNVGTNKIVTLGTPTATGTDAKNYVLSLATPTIFSHIAPKPLTIIGMKADTRMYDGTNIATFNTVTTRGKLSGMVTGETSTLNINYGFVSNGTSSYTSGATAFANRQVGVSKLVTLATLTLTGTSVKDNYTLVTPAVVYGTITAKPLTVTATCVPKRWDGNTNATVQLTGTNLVLASGETVTDVVTLRGTATFADANIGINKLVTVRSIIKDGADAGNYSLATGLTVTCRGTIN